MTDYTTANGLRFMGEGKQMDIIKKRDEFVKKWCEEKGVSINNLSMTQILELRKEEGWKNPR